ncbi:putative MSP (Major sperm protein) domain containing protein [Lyophyllum shimeji]|uniref:MSP (Major sperm protein) domain containing protein n=1 Tax=Lyophyllum shimeji TaxID=47721 RepID=A0A9P3ULQ6_LYOSH|nr:putative MSP (Major sperm protein) domain containing protein [Lyophyllum shimeji]
MSVSIDPSCSLKFQGPFTRSSESSLTITNHNTQPVDFKLKTITSKSCHTLGRIEPGGSVEIPVTSQPLSEEIVSKVVFKDALIVESSLVPSRRNFRRFRDSVMRRKKNIHQQKLDVEFSPAPRPVASEESGNTEATASGAAALDSLHETEMKFRQLKAEYEAQKPSKPSLGTLLSIEALRLLAGPERRRR